MLLTACDLERAIDRANRALAEKEAEAGALAVKPEPPKPPPPPDQEISVNLTFAGMAPDTGTPALGFEFKALWGEHRDVSKSVSVPLSAGKGETSLDLGEAKLRIVPQIVSSQRGVYEVHVTSPAGKPMGSYKIAETGKQVEVARWPEGYDVRLAYYDPEKRITAYTVGDKGKREPRLGLVFVGQGWSYVEQFKKPDLSKGYLFPEIDVVVLPEAWMADNTLRASCERLKAGQAVGGGRCYS